MLSDLLLRLRAIFKRSAVEHALDEELGFHVNRQIETYVSRGIDRDEARRRVRLEFGGLDQVKEEYRDALGVRLLDDLWRDIRYALRTVRRTPGFAATAIISIALGVGANTIVFSVVHALVLKPLPVSDPDRVVFVQRVGSFVSHSFPFYRDLRDRNVTFEGLAGYRITMMEVEANQSATHEWGYLATGNYFDLLGVTPALGRFFRQADDVAAGASPCAVLSYDYWLRRFGATPSVVGSTIRLNRLPYTVVGVAPASFYGTEVFYRPDIWVPMSMQAQIEVGNPWLENRNTSNTWVIGRLKRGVSAAYGNSLPLNIDQSSTGVYLDDRPDLPRSRMPRAIKYQVSPGFFQTLGIRMLQGRDIDWRDTSASRRVVVVNEAFANQILGGRDVLGRHLRYGAQGPPIEVVGVVETGKYQSLTEAETPAVFEPILQAYNTTTVMLVRASRPSAEVASDIRRVMHSLDPSLPLFGVRGVEEMLGFVLLPMRVAAVALGAFGVLAVMLAATGIHGIVSYAVARRRREIAIRVAVGATGRSILQLVLRRIAIPVVLGVLTGFPLAVATGGLLGSIVYQGSVNDASTMLGVFAIVALVGLMACWLPARRALRLQAATALYLE